MPKRTIFLPAEWHKQSAVQLTWPHAATDWKPILKDVIRCYLDMAKAISEHEELIIVTPEPEHVQGQLERALPAENMQRITLCQIPTNDTWARDHGFITLLAPDGFRLLDFKFNGWGEKFAAELDNQICRRMMELRVLDGKYEDHLDFVLEGGSIESDGCGTILTTSQCLLAPHRNQPLTQAQIEARLLSSLHAERILWLDTAIWPETIQTATLTHWHASAPRTQLPTCNAPTRATSTTRNYVSWKHSSRRSARWMESHIVSSHYLWQRLHTTKTAIDCLPHTLTS